MKTYVCGHRNPDVDTVMSAYALADLRRRTGDGDVEAICAGRVPARAQWVFDHFHLKPLRARRDVYPRVRDLIDSAVPMIPAEMPLVDALRLLEKSGESSLPVRDRLGRFAGMLSPAKLLSLFIDGADLTRPVGEAPLHHCSQVLVDGDCVHDVKKAAIRNAHNHFPVVDEGGHLLGTVLKRAFAATWTGSYTSSKPGSGPIPPAFTGNCHEWKYSSTNREGRRVLFQLLPPSTLDSQKPLTQSDERSISGLNGSAALLLPFAAFSACIRTHFNS